MTTHIKNGTFNPAEKVLLYVIILLLVIPGRTACFIATLPYPIMSIDVCRVMKSLTPEQQRHLHYRSTK